MKKESIKNRLIVHCLVKVDGKYLIIKRSIIKRGKPNVFPEYWDIPGGMVENGELPKDALIRECKEEVGLDIEIGNIIHEDSNLDHDKNTIFTRLVYLGETKQTEKDIVLQLDEHTEYKLVDDVRDIEKVVSFVEKIFNDF